MESSRNSSRSTMIISKNISYSKDNEKSLYVGGYAERGDEISKEINSKKKPLTILNERMYAGK